MFEYLLNVYYIASASVRISIIIYAQAVLKAA
jgi:hypothetical protein